MKRSAGAPSRLSYASGVRAKLPLFLSTLGLTSALAAFAACVGDDPSNPAATAEAGVPDAGSSGGDGSTPGDDGGGGDASSDGSSPGDAGADAATYDVRALAGLRLWLESTKELTADVGTGFGAWFDQSARWDAGASGAPDGGRHVALPHDVNPPSIVANGIAGRPTVSFVSGNGYLHIANHGDFQFGLGDFFIAEVAKVTSGSGPLWMLRPQATAGTEEAFFPGQLCVAYGLGVNNGCTTPVYTPSTEPHVFVARRKSDVFTLRVDGSVRSTLDRTGEPPDIGISEFAQDFAFIGENVTMQVSELVIVVGPTADGDLEALEKHLKDKYLIP